ncbi:MAG: R-phenyllactate dehydratase beta subunit [Candidatus Heimdallarchaeota archaeon LC_2]|nr:MAG: R-phenyllactate dehydratase beta subunit [Candidatus Heimdallarchaeota archaeon LC_2]
MSLKAVLEDSVDYIENFSNLLEKEEYKQKSVIYFTADIPIEIISAAGLIPVRIPSDANGPQSQYNTNSVLQPFICSKSHQFFDFISKNGKNLIAGIFSENHCDSLQNFYDVVKMNKTLDDDFQYFRFLLPIKRGGKTETKYYFKEMQRLVSWFENLTGTQITFENLSSSIQLHNTKRALLTQISKYIRDRDHQKITMSEYVKLKLLTDIIPVKESVEILNKTVESISKIKSDKEQGSTLPRVLISGSMFDNFRLFESIEILNKTSIATDLSFISRSSDFQILVPELETKDKDELLMNLAEAYIINKIPDSVHHHPGRRLEYLKNLIHNHQIDGVVFIQYSFCDPDAFESRGLSLHLEKNMSIPTLTLVTDPQLTNLNQMTTRVEAFMEKIGDY